MKKNEKALEKQNTLLEQKEEDLERAQARKTSRPIKKELRHSQIDGRYIVPKEIKKEVEKLEKEKKKFKKKKSFFSRFLGGVHSQDYVVENILKDQKKAEDKKQEKHQQSASSAMSLEERRKKIEKIKHLRGIYEKETTSFSLDDFDFEDSQARAQDSFSSEFDGVKGFDGFEETLETFSDSQGFEIDLELESFETFEEEEVFEDSKALNQDSFNSFAEQTQSKSVFTKGESTDKDKRYPSIAKSFSFSQSVARLTGAYEPSSFIPEQQDAFEINELDASELSEDVEEMNALFAPDPSAFPDGPIATALCVAAGFIYWDEENRLVDRVITIRRLFSRQGDILMDAFCHDILAPRLIPFSKGVELYNIQTMKSYENPRDFLLYSVAAIENSGRFSSSSFAAVLSEVRYELAALAFTARVDYNKSDEENDLMMTYISRRCPTIAFDAEEMLDYISILVPDEQSFFESIGLIVKQSEEIVTLFTQTFMQMLFSDGILHEKERELLAELLYVLRLEGIDLRKLGLQ